MKYLIMIYSNPENWEHPVFAQVPAFRELSATDRDELVRQSEELLDEIHRSGEFVAGVALSDPSLARTVSPRDGVPATTDGPYVESKEQLAGYFVVDCETLGRAEEIASRFPDARFTAVEVRPIMGMAGHEM